jgi:ribosomal protein L7/L12
LPDDTIIGKIGPVNIWLGEFRRLQQAVERESVKPTENYGDSAILTLLRAYQRIQAIKLRRELTSEQLIEAKNYVDKLGLDAGLFEEVYDKYARGHKHVVYKNSGRVF